MKDSQALFLFGIFCFIMLVVGAFVQWLTDSNTLTLIVVVFTWLLYGAFGTISYARDNRLIISGMNRLGRFILISVLTLTGAVVLIYSIDAFAIQEEKLNNINKNN